jgi:hypothetical protein
MVDANILVYGTVEQMPHHEIAREWLSQTLSGRTRVGLPWSSLLAYVRIVSNPRVFTKPIPISVAWAQVKIWLEQPPAWVPAPTERHQETLEKMLQSISTSNHVPDAELASLAIQHGLELMTADRGFARFPGLRFRNPLD